MTSKTKFGLAYARDKMATVAKLLKPSHLAAYSKRKEMLPVLSNIVKECDTACGYLNKSSPQAKEIRFIRNVCVSLIQDANDSKSVKKIVPLVIEHELSSRSKTVAKVISKEISSEPVLTLVENIKSNPEPEIEPQAVLAANKYTTTLHGFEGLEKLAQQLVADQAKLNILKVNEEKKNPSPGATKLEQEATEFQNKGGQNLVSPAYDNRLDENIVKVRRAILEASKALPSASTIKAKLAKADFVPVESPLIVYPFGRIPDLKMKKSAIKFQTLIMTAPIVDQAGGRIPNDSSYLGTILYNQLLVAFDVKMLSNVAKLAKLADTAKTIIESRRGQLVQISFGATPRMLDYRQSDDISFQRGEDRKTVEQTKKAIEKDNIKEENKLRSLNKNAFFTDKNYPGLMFTWLLSHDQYSAISPVKFKTIGFPIGANMAKESEQLNTDSNELIKTRRLNEQNEKVKIDTLRQKRIEKESDTKDKMGQLEQNTKSVVSQLKADLDNIKDMIVRVKEHAQEEQNLIGILNTQLTSARSRIITVQDKKSSEFVQLSKTILQTMDDIAVHETKLTAIKTEEVVHLVALQKDLSAKINETMQIERQKLGLK